jgi:signal transduction histidine kinase
VSDSIARGVFGLMFDTSAEAIFVVDRIREHIVSANLRFADMLQRDQGSLIGMSLASLSCEPERDLMAQGHYEEVALRRGDDFPVHVEMQVAHVDHPEHGALAAYMARDTTERRRLEGELLAKHAALYMAHAELEKAHKQLGETKVELERRNHEIAMLAWRAAMGEVVAGIAHHLNNPVGALSSTVRLLQRLNEKLPTELRAEYTRLLTRITQAAQRIESNVGAIVQATRANAIDDENGRRELPPELANVLSSFSERLDDIPTKEKS